MKNPVGLSVLCWLVLSGFSLPAVAERINQEGRILGPLPVVTNAILFDTTNADAVVSAMQIFPVTNPWNEDVSQRPVLTNSDAMIAQIIFDLTNGLSLSSAASHRNLHINYEMNFVLVPDNQPRVPIDFFNYPDESDLDGGKPPYGLYPIPTNLPVEEWPLGTGTQTLQQWQMNDDGSDRHAIMVAPGAGYIWETWETTLVGTNWEASNGAKFNLNTNGLRPAGWTSGDAAGLPMFPALVRYDEAERGMVEHACRVTVKRTRYNNYIYPATHYAASSGNTNVNLPSMGQRLRLKASFVIPANWSQEEKAVALGLKKYGAIVADNGSVFGISVTPDDRWPNGLDCFDDLFNVGITNFEVIQTTGPNEGPRSPGAPVAYAGPDQTVLFGQWTPLQGFVAYSNTPTTIQWKLYSESGDGTVTLAGSSQTNTMASFSEPGIYTLELSAADGVHAVAYDAVTITVTNSVIHLSIARGSANAIVSWTGGAFPYVVQESGAPTGLWNDMATTSVQNVSLPITNAAEFFRVRSEYSQ